jgi:hypothetical protein
LTAITCAENDGRVSAEDAAKRRPRPRGLGRRRWAENAATLRPWRTNYELSDLAVLVMCRAYYYLPIPKLATAKIQRLAEEKFAKFFWNEASSAP